MVEAEVVGEGSTEVADTLVAEEAFVTLAALVAVAEVAVEGQTAAAAAVEAGEVVAAGVAGCGSRSCGIADYRRREVSHRRSLRNSRPSQQKLFVAEDEVACYAFSGTHPR